MMENRRGEQGHGRHPIQTAASNLLLRSPSTGSYLNERGRSALDDGNARARASSPPVLPCIRRPERTGKELLRGARQNDQGRRQQELDGSRANAIAHACAPLLLTLDSSIVETTFPCTSHCRCDSRACRWAALPRNRPRCGRHDGGSFRADEATVRAGRDETGEYTCSRRIRGSGTESRSEAYARSEDQARR
jgi:hypothetical protein